MVHPALRISRRVGKFATDRYVVAWFIAVVVMYAAFTWLRAHPQHDPFAPLDLRDPVGIATDFKLASLIEDPAVCAAALQRSKVEFRTLPASGEGPCALLDRTQMTAAPLTPARPVSTCSVAAGLQMWLNTGLQKAAETHLESRVVRIEHLGTNSCRRVNNSPNGPWSEHAPGNAIDIAAFVLKDGRRVSVLDDWEKGEKGAFLAAARDSACDSFKTVLSPDYNAQHANHFHLDQGTRWGSVCR